MKHHLKVALIVAGLSACHTAPAQVVWNFGTTAGSAAPSSNSLTNLAVSSLTHVNNNGSTTLLSTTSASSGYGGASGQYNAAASTAAGTSLNTTTATAFQFTLTPDEGYSLTISNISFATRSSSTGATQVAVRSSIDGFGTDLATGASPNGSWSLLSPGSFSSITATSPVTIRIYGYGNTLSSTGTANWRIDDLSVNASVSAIPEPSTYAAIAGAGSLLGAIWWRRRNRNRAVEPS